MDNAISAAQELCLKIKQSAIDLDASRARRGQLQADYDTAKSAREIALANKNTKAYTEAVSETNHTEVLLKKEFVTYSELAARKDAARLDLENIGNNARILLDAIEKLRDYSDDADVTDLKHFFEGGTGVEYQGNRPEDNEMTQEAAVRFFATVNADREPRAGVIDLFGQLAEVFKGHAHTMARKCLHCVLREM